MIKNNLRYAALLVFVIIAGLRFSDLYSVFGIKPDLLLIFLIRRSLNEPKPHLSVTWAFFAGMTNDVIAGDVTGISSLVYSICCFSASVYKRNSAYLPPYKRTLLYVYATVFSALIIYAVSLSNLSPVTIVFYNALPSAFYTLIISAVLQSLKPTK